MVLVAIVIASLVIPGALDAVSGTSRWLDLAGSVWLPFLRLAPPGGGAVAGNGVTDSGFADETGRARVFLRRLTLFVAVCIGIVQVGDFVWALRRYTVGLGTTVDPFAGYGRLEPTNIVVDPGRSRDHRGGRLLLVDRETRTHSAGQRRGAHRHRLLDGAR